MYVYMYWVIDLDKQVSFDLKDKSHFHLLFDILQDAKTSNITF